jgi:hypothetical protein
MKLVSRFFVCVAIGAVLAVVAPTSASADHGDQQGQIEGAWVVSITGGPGTPPLPSWYQALATFTREGSLIETITDPSIGTGHGRWTRGRGREVGVTTLLFRFDATGDFLGTLRARANLTVDRSGNEFTSDEYLFEFFDRNGTLLTSGVGKAHGKRIVVVSLP